MQFYVCLLRHAKNDDATKAILREMYKKDIQFKLIDKNSKIDWSLKNDIILGGLKNIIGVGEKSAQLLYRKITNQETLTVRQQKLLKEGITPFDNLFQLRDRWVSIYNDPEKFRIQSELATLVDVNFNDGRKGHCFIENKSLLTKKSTIRKTAHQRPWHLDYLSKGNICFYLLYDNKEMNWGIHVEDLEFIAWYDNLVNIFDELLASNSMNDFKKRIFNE